MADPTVIRCSVPDCAWGYDCYEAYRFHCIEGHGADASSEFYVHFDLEKLLLSVFQK
jgi:hypothetical protein